MADENIQKVGVKAVVENMSGFEAAARQVSSQFGMMNQGAQKAGSGFGGMAAGFAGGIATMIAAAGAMLALNFFEKMASGITSIMQHGIDMNAFYQRSEMGFKVLLQNAEKNAAKTTTTVAKAGEDSASSVGNAVRDINERIQDAMSDHGERMAELSNDMMQTVGQGITQIQTELGAKLGDLAEQHAENIRSLEAEISDVMANTGEQIAERTRQTQQTLADLQENFNEQRRKSEESFQQSLTDLAEQHAERRKNIEEQVADAAYNFAQQQRDRAEKLAEQKASVEEQFAGTKEQLEKRLATAGTKRSADQIQKAINDLDEKKAVEMAKLDEKFAAQEAKELIAYNRQLAKLQQRLADEDAEYAKQTARKTADYNKRVAEEDAQLAKQKNKTLAAEAEDIARIQKNGAQRVADLQKRISQENAAYDKQRAKIQADADADTVKQQERNAQRLADLEKSLAKETLMYERQMRDMAQQAATATIGGGKKPLDRSSYNEMNSFLGRKEFAGVSGDEEEKAIQRTKILMAELQKIAESTRATTQEVTATAFDLMARGLDPLKWMKPLAGAAQIFGKPVEQMANAVGALASGRGGEAVQMLLDAGINLRQILGDDAFNAQNELIMPLEAVMSKLYDTMKTEYEPLLSESANSWDTLTSNMGDFFDKYAAQAAKPLFDQLLVGLKKLTTWFSDPKNMAMVTEWITKFGQVFGNIASFIIDNWDTIKWVFVALGVTLGVVFLAIGSAIVVLTVSIMSMVAVFLLVAAGVATAIYLIKALWDNLGIWLGDFFGLLFNMMLTFVGSAEGGGILGVFWGAFNWLGEMMMNFWGRDEHSGIQGLFWDAMDSIGNIASGFWTTITDIFDGIKKGIEDIWNGLWGVDENSGVQKIFRDALSGLEGIAWSILGRDKYSGLQNVFWSVFEMIGNLFKTILNPIIDLINGMFGAINNMIDTLYNLPQPFPLPQPKPRLNPIPKLATGGIVPGAEGAGIMAMVHGGEGVLSVEAMRIFSNAVTLFTRALNVGASVDNRTYTTVNANYAGYDSEADIGRALSLRDMMMRAGA